MKRSFAHYLVESFREYGEKKAIIFYRQGVKETVLTYEQMDRLTNKAANAFLKMGVQKGDRAILLLPKSLAFVISYIGLQKIGAISVPLNPGLKKAEIGYFIEDADPRLIICGEGQKELVKQAVGGRSLLVLDTRIPYQELNPYENFSNQDVLADVGPGDPAVIIYTSGTTGRPKGAVLTQANIIHDALNVVHVWEINSKDTICHALPLFHVHGLCFAFHTAMIAGARILMLDQFRAEHVVQLLSEKNEGNKCSIFMAVPAMYGRLLDYLGNKKIDFSHIRLWASGSAPLLPKDFRRINEVLGKEPVEREGMSETGMNFSNPLYGRRKPGSVGIPLPGLEVRIVDPKTMTDVPFGEVGEIWLRGPSISPGYWKKAQETKEAFVEGWFRTGDLGRIDEDGYFYITDRIKHIIISGGENISPKEIEDVINQHEAVAECCVVGIPDEKWGEKVVAAVVPNPGVSIGTEEIKAHCKRYLHDWKCPKEVVFSKNLPKNTMGKVLKEEVRNMFRSRV